MTPETHKICADCQSKCPAFHDTAYTISRITAGCTTGGQEVLEKDQIWKEGQKGEEEVSVQVY